MGLVNAVVPVAKLEAEGVKWANEILGHSPLAIRCLKSAFNADVDGQAGIQELAGNATLLYYMSDERRNSTAPSARSGSPTRGNIRGCLRRAHAVKARFPHEISWTEGGRRPPGGGLNRSQSLPRPKIAVHPSQLHDSG